MGRTPNTSRTRTRGVVGLIVVVGALLAATLTACGNTEPRNLIESIRSGKVTLGTKYDQPGLGIRNPDKTVTGFDPSVSTYVVNHIADELGVGHPEITWRETPSAQRETLINNGEVDMIAATYSINAARAKKVDFAGPYLINYQGLLVRSDDDSITSLTDLDTGHKKLCSVTGSTPAQNVKAQLPSVQLQEYDSYSSCVEALRRSKVDAMTTDEVILAGYANFYPGEFKIVGMTYPKDACVKDVLKTAGTPFSKENYGIGMAKQYPDAVVAVNKALQKMIETGAWDKALREAIGNAYVDEMIARAEHDSQYKFFPSPSVETVESITDPTTTPTPCPAGLS
ncbi:glutamate ABC transporter substrate-binding protein [Gordonia desulfuricans]|uniref:Glutamate ABC transporter substrate-binding protein n=1 Tax=Gordonia desulfuricans TaxID=89051 RepID=A0A7K3LMN9_9ACTN|nr:MULTISPECIES: glutamate ABC transporter substrate-binding protein [Gordonia]EMP13187.1 ABC transporter substrate-binding protein [Gordonia sp. NB41Y]NDK89453.1 glutamate ABC transporter substrate-binding protein [Gordonia desulfuricans]WLP91109.1 glutamate ABC transporter substrate-binding protein [Gordonia sp. NB41Y]